MVVWVCMCCLTALVRFSHAPIIHMAIAICRFHSSSAWRDFSIVCVCVEWMRYWWETVWFLMDLHFTLCSVVFSHTEYLNNEITWPPCFIETHSQNHNLSVRRIRHVVVVALSCWIGVTDSDWFSDRLLCWIANLAVELLVLFPWRKLWLSYFVVPQGVEWKRTTPLYNSFDHCD